MSQQDQTEQQPQAEDGQIVERLNRLSGRTPRTRGRKLGAIATGGVFLLAAAIMIAPEEIRSIFPRTSESEDYQKTSTADPGLSTQFSNREIDTAASDTIDTGSTSIDVPAPATPPEDSEELRRLQAELDRMKAALEEERGVDPTRLSELMDAQAARLQEVFDRQLEEERRKHEAELRIARASSLPVGPSPEDVSEQEARQRLEEERARRAAIREEQIRSPALLYDNGEATAGGGSAGSRDLNDNESFLRSASRQPHETVKSTRIANPSRTLVQGTIIEAVLETALSTELPGTLRAVTSVDVYSYDGENILLPRGTRLIGTYSSDVTLAQSRALIAWNRAITPDGDSVSLGGIGGDRLGRSGQTGFVDTRFGERFGTAALISVLGIAPSLVVDDDASFARQELAEDLGGDLRNTTAGVLNDYLSLPPVVYVDQGAELTVFVDRDIVF